MSDRLVPDVKLASNSARPSTTESETESAVSTSLFSSAYSSATMTTSSNGDVSYSATTQTSKSNAGWWILAAVAAGALVAGGIYLARRNKTSNPRI